MPLRLLHIFYSTMTLMILGNIMAVPEDVREAAMLDGASGLKQYWYITIPMIKDTLRTGIYPFGNSGLPAL